MLSAQTLDEIRDDARAFCARYGLEPGCCLVELCERATGSPPVFERAATGGRYAEGRVYLSTGRSPARTRTTLSHELGHVYHESIGYNGPDLEDRCSFVGACMIADERDVRAFIRRTGRHAYKLLAAELECTQALALLRISEVTGRPALVLRESGEPIVRGRDFAWPSVSTLVRSMTSHRSRFHYAKITDEPGRHAFLADRAAWADMGG